MYLNFSGLRTLKSVTPTLTVNVLCPKFFI